MQLQPRREVVEFGLLPLYALCPQLDSPATLASMHARVMAQSRPTPNGQRGFLFYIQIQRYA